MALHIENIFKRGIDQSLMVRWDLDSFTLTIHTAKNIPDLINRAWSLLGRQKLADYVQRVVVN